MTKKNIFDVVIEDISEMTIEQRVEYVLATSRELMEKHGDEEYLTALITYIDFLQHKVKRLQEENRALTNKIQ